VNNDDELLSLLGRAFRPAQGEPPPRLISALRESVAAQAGKVANGLPRRRWLGRRPVALLAGAALLLSTGTAYAAVEGIPDPVRSAAHAVGLPVTAPDIHDLHSAEGKLRHALARHDPAEAARQAANVRGRLSGLSAGERAHEAESAENLLDRQAALSRGTATTVAPAPSAETPGVPGAPPEEQATTTAPATDESSAVGSSPSTSGSSDPGTRPTPPASPLPPLSWESSPSPSSPSSPSSSAPSSSSVPVDPDSGG
jgi:hypothetical protein